MLEPTTLPTAMPGESASAGAHRDHHLRRRCAEGNNRQADYDRRNAEFFGKANRSTDQKVAA